MEVTIGFGDRIITLPVSFLLALICLALFLRYRRQVLSDRGRWVATRTPVPPNLNATRSAFDVMWDGTSGCFWSLIGALAMFFVALIAVDLVLSGGAYSRDILFVLFNG
ncbi:MAG: hypothetical protein HY328_15320 [Chloroflexi bacterium]|nr:hypothetical protein [Chloroflexota bacterium]